MRDEYHVYCTVYNTWNNRASTHVLYFKKHDNLLIQLQLLSPHVHCTFLKLHLYCKH